MRTILLLIFICLFSTMSMAQPRIDVPDSFSLMDALNYAQAAGVDTIMLTTSGGLYKTAAAAKDTFLLEIYEPIVIMAAPGLAEKPILIGTDPDSNQLEIFRLMNDVTFDGLVFDGGHDLSHGMKYAMRVGHSGDPADNPTETRHFVKDGMNITIRNCDFRNFHADKLPEGEGHALYYLKPTYVGVDPTIRTGKVLIENCTFYDFGYEAIRMTETEKYVVDRVMDTLIVRNCSFSDIDAECIRFYGDLDSSKTTIDAYALLEHLTVDRSAPRVIYAKNSRNTIVRDVIITNSRLSEYKGDRNNFAMQIQLPGSYISNIDTMNLVFQFPQSETIAATKGGDVDTTTIWGFDPMYADAENRDYTLLEGSRAYGYAATGLALGDLRWAKVEWSSVDGNPETRLPDHFALDQNYPNPFNPSTTITYTISQPTHVKLRVYNLVGQMVDVLENAYRTSGTYKVEWQPANLASGIYFYRLDVDNQTFVKKMAFVK